MSILLLKFNIAFYMPNPNKYDSEGKFMTDCVPERKSKGDNHNQAVATCLSIYRNKSKRKSNK